MIKVCISGCRGRMGALLVTTVLDQGDMQLVSGVDPSSDGDTLDVEHGHSSNIPVFKDLASALSETKPDCVVDFSVPSAVAQNIKVTLEAGVDCIVGTTGLSEKDLGELENLIPAGKTLFIAPNFTIGAILMMRFAVEAAKYFPDAEIIEYHHNRKADSPSGTAIETARRMSAQRDAFAVKSSAPGKETELDGYAGARGASFGTVPIHAIRSDAFMASQEVILGSQGQKLVLHHDSHDRLAYMPGVLLAIRSMPKTSGLIVGLEALMGDS